MKRTQILVLSTAVFGAIIGGSIAYLQIQKQKAQLTSEKSSTIIAR